MIDNIDKEKFKLLTRKEKRQHRQTEKEQEYASKNFLLQYFKDCQFNAKRESAKERHIMDFFKVTIHANCIV